MSRRILYTCLAAFLLWPAIACSAPQKPNVAPSSKVSSPHVPAPSRGGVYENVRYIEEAGDVLGTAVDYRAGLSPHILVTLCEGECRGGKTWPVTVRGDNIYFTVCDGPWVDQDNVPVPCTPLVYTGAFRADGSLKLTVAGYEEQKEILHRVSDPKPHWVEQLGCNANSC